MRAPGAKRSALIFGLAAALFFAAGCTRRFFRDFADKQVEELLDEKDIYPPWHIEQWHVYPDCRARFADPTNPDRPMKPYDDPAAKYLSPNPQPGKKVGEGGFIGTGWVDLLHKWDAENRLDPDANTAPRPAQSALPPPTRTTESDQNALRTQERPFRIKLEQAVELGLINSREFQDRREDLYFAALAVTLQRFAFVAQFALGQQVFRESVGRDLPDAGNRWSAITNASVSKLFPTGALLLIQFANQVVINLGGGPGPRTITPSTLSLDIAQPLLQGGGKAVTLEPLTQSERDLLYEIRAYARFRKQYFVAVAGGAGTGIVGSTLGASFPAGVFPVQPLPASGLSLVIGYLPTLLRSAFYVNQRNNVAELERYVTFYRQLQGGGDVSPLQTDQIVSRLLDSRRALLNAEQDFRDGVDQFKILIGVPTDLPLELDDTPVRPVTRQLERLRAVFEDDRGLLQEQRPLGDADAALARAEFRRRYTELPLVQGTAFREQIVARLDRWERLPAPGLDAEVRRVRADRDALFDRQQRVEADGQSLAPDDQRRLDELNLELNLGLFEQFLRDYEARPWEAAGLADIERQARRSRLFRQLFDAFVRVLGTARDQRLEQVRSSWPDLPRACVNGVDLVTADLDTAITAASQAALTNRLDLMNARGSVVDAWRQVAVTANALLGVTDVQYHLDTSTPPLTNRPFDFRGNLTRSRLTLNWELPLVRRLQRNNYRTALIGYQRARRSLQAAEDRVLLEVRGEVRELRVQAETYKIQQRAVPVGYSQRDNSLEQLRIPNPPGSGSSAGNAAALTQQLLSTQNTVVNSENALYQVYVGYLIARLQLFRDLELMPLDPRGVWIDEHAVRDCGGPCDLPGTAPGPASGPEPERERPERLPPPKPVEPAWTAPKR
jgi:hypothetical protein